MQARDMRTTLAIDDDVLLAAKAIAEQKNRPLGEIISDLARRSLHRPQRAAAKRNGIPLLPRKKGMPSVTLATVNALRDELP
jgi:hypothetical protein